MGIYESVAKEHESYRAYCYDRLHGRESLGCKRTCDYYEFCHRKNKKITEEDIIDKGWQ